MTAEERALIEATAKTFAVKLKEHHEAGFGVFPSARPDENFYRQVWTRDLAQAAPYFATYDPQGVADSLRTLFSHQRADGALPLRVEKQYALLRLIPGFRSLARPSFRLIEGVFRHRRERPVYEAQDFSSAEDTIPAALIALGDWYRETAEGKAFARAHYQDLVRAIDYFGKKIDPTDSLVRARIMNADWADSIMRGGKLGGLNVYWAHGLGVMAKIAADLRKPEAGAYANAFDRTRAGIKEKLYDPLGAYIRAEEGGVRLDTAATIFGSLYLLSVEEAVSIEETLKRRVRTSIGLKNFDPAYPLDQILWPFRLIGHEGYHNKYVWPWLGGENIRVKIKIAREHKDETVRSRYRSEALGDLLNLARLFESAGGAYEIFDPETARPAATRLYKPPRYFMANMVTFVYAYRELKKLEWI